LIFLIHGEAAGLEVGVVDEPGKDAGGGLVLGERDRVEEKNEQRDDEVDNLHLVGVV
jgi:hypothetical protein